VRQDLSIPYLEQGIENKRKGRGKDGSEWSKDSDGGRLTMLFGNNNPRALEGIRGVTCMKVMDKRKGK